MMSNEAGSFYDDFTKSPYLPFKGEEEHNQRLIAPETTHLSTAAVDLRVTTSAPPSAYFHTPARSSVPTVEQEMYAQPFIEALQQRYRHDGSTVSQELQCHSPPCITHPYATAVGPNPSLESTAPTYVTATMSDLNSVLPGGGSTSYPVTTSHDPSFAGSYMPMTTFSHSHAVSEAYPAPLPGFNVIAHTAGSTLGSLQSRGFTTEQPSTMSHDMLRHIVPADMRTMENMKVERKKARNRIAASKCRLRRLQREGDLQEKVQRLKDHNEKLNNELNSLREKVHGLKKILMKHMNTGCNVQLPQGFRTDTLSSTGSE